MNAIPGTITPCCVLIQPKRAIVAIVAIVIVFGTTVRRYGTIIVPSTRAKSNPPPRNLKRAKAYAASTKKLSAYLSGL